MHESLQQSLSYRYDQQASSLQYPLPQRQQTRYHHQQQHEYIDPDPASSTLFMQAWLNPTYGTHQEGALHDPNMHTSSLVTSNGQFALSSNDIHQHLGSNNLAPGSPSSISTSISEVSSAAAFQGSHISSPATTTTTNTGNATAEEPTTTQTSSHASTTIEKPSAPVPQIEDWKQRAHEAIWATNSYQRKGRRCRSSNNQVADDNEKTTSSHHNDDTCDEVSSLQSSSSQPTSAKKRRVITGYSVTCEQCNIHFTRDRDLRRHNLSKHVRQRYVCDHCSTSFTRNDSKVRHERKCTRKKDRRDDDLLRS